MTPGEEFLIVLCVTHLHRYPTEVPLTYRQMIKLAAAMERNAERKPKR